MDDRLLVGEEKACITRTKRFYTFFTTIFYGVARLPIFKAGSALGYYGERRLQLGQNQEHQNSNYFLVVFSFRLLRSSK